MSINKEKRYLLELLEDLLTCQWTSEIYFISSNWRGYMEGVPVINKFQNTDGLVRGEDFFGENNNNESTALFRRT